MRVLVLLGQSLVAVHQVEHICTNVSRITMHAASMLQAGHSAIPSAAVVPPPCLDSKKPHSITLLPTLMQI